jgi:RNA polymerase sigma-70 factor (ECF subfamily)
LNAPLDELVTQAQRGDDDAFSALYTMFWPNVRGLTYQRLQNADEADDAAQLTFVKAWRAISATTPDLRFKSWLLTIADNACLDVLRRRQRWMMQPWVDHAHDELLLAQPTDRPEEATERASEAAAAWRAMDRLTDQRDRTLLVLTIVDGLPFRDVGEIMGMTWTAVKSACFRARIDLRAAYAKEVA